MPPNRFAALTCALLTFSSAITLTAQQRDDTPKRRSSAAIMLGVSQFDLSGTGTSPIASGRIDTELLRWLVAEGSLGLFRPDEQFGQQNSYAVPEAQLQIQLPLRVMRPYLGIGAGSFIGGGRGTRLTVSGAAGLRIALPSQPLDLRGELRVRGIGASFGGAAAEWTGGVAYRW